MPKILKLMAMRRTGDGSRWPVDAGLTSVKRIQRDNQGAVGMYSFANFSKKRYETIVFAFYFISIAC